MDICKSGLGDVTGLGLESATEVTVLMMIIV